MYFELNFFHYNLNDKIYGQVYPSKYFGLVPLIGSHRTLFCGDNHISKKFKKLSLVETYSLIKTQDFILQPKTFLKSITEVFTRLF